MSGCSIQIKYCQQCNWLARSAWMAQEILHTFSAQTNSLSLVPVTGGVFEIWVNQQLIWSRKQEGGFPSVKELKQRIRDVIDPERDLGHVDRK